MQHHPTYDTNTHTHNHTHTDLLQELDDLFLAVIEDESALPSETTQSECSQEGLENVGGIQVEDRRKLANGMEEVKVCGTTSHFTDFAIFLGGSNGLAESCGSSHDFATWLWVLHVASVIFVVGLTPHDYELYLVTSMQLLLSFSFAPCFMYDTFNC